MMRNLMMVICALALAGPGCKEVDDNNLHPDGGQGTQNDTDGDSFDDDEYDSKSSSIVSSFDGVDLLIVIDNSLSMEAEQEILSTGIYTLINSLSNPLSNDPSWGFPAIENMRVAVVTSDMGLQFGDGGSLDGFPYGLQIQGCTNQDGKGDDGQFMATKPARISPQNKYIDCEIGGGQCPENWTCKNNLCESPDDSGWVDCPNSDEQVAWATKSKENPDSSFTTQIACMAQQGTTGCGVEQQLEAAVRGLSRTDQRDSFLVDDHLLAVLIVSDEEDCSIADKDLFSTDEFKSGAGSTGLLNTGCNLPASNEDNYLFDTKRYWQKLVELKDNQAAAVVFGAIVGVPPASGKESSVCEGSGDMLANCLDTEKMSLKVQEFSDPSGRQFMHFAPACERHENNTTVTSARPGRRYVEVAQDFGPNGYVYSICNADWSPAMKDLAGVIASNISSTCYPKKLGWKQTTTANTDDCPECGLTSCDLFIELVELQSANNEATPTCPPELGGSDAVQHIEEVLDSSGNLEFKRIHCLVPQIPAPLDCDFPFDEEKKLSKTGWYYCELRGAENFNDSCEDSIDNDKDGNVDCNDSECKSCPACGGMGDTCKDGCLYNLRLTETVKETAKGNTVTLRCRDSV